MRTVVFASGKGGTGKTTIAALAAIHRAHGTRVVLVDADVEAPNLSIALGARETGRVPFEGGPVAVIDAARCRGCGACARRCRFDALVPPAGYGPRAYTVDAWSCEGCGACVPACPYDAITMVRKRAGWIVEAEASTGALVAGELAPGEDLSGKLVTEVRSRAAALAAAQGADALLIDGPPGVGCPVIASVTNTDLLVVVSEPTVSGAHDLERLLTLAARLDVPVGVVANKADLSPEGLRHLGGVADRHHAAWLGEVPFDPVLARLMAGLVGVASGHPEPLPSSDGVRAALAVIDRAFEHVG